MLAVVLPDGSGGMILAAATDVLGQGLSEARTGTVLSADGVRRLRALLEAKARSRGSKKSRGTRRRAA
jgi:hypothetical protein